MEGNGVKGFTTPLATLHKFQGWADKFLATPVNGIEDEYVNLSARSRPSAVSTRSPSSSASMTTKPSASTRTTAGIQCLGGREVQEVNAMLKYADYEEGVLASARNTQKLWCRSNSSGKTTTGGH